MSEAHVGARIRGKRLKPRMAGDVAREFDLPAPLVLLVCAVADRCRLWPREREDVARELSCHCADALASGRSPDEIVQSFGDVKRARKLITASRKRMRPLWWQSMRATRRAIGIGAAVLLVAYAGLAAKVALSETKVTRNFLSELRAKVDATDPADRAWPVYLEARKQIGVQPEFMTDPEHPMPTKPSDVLWPAMVEWCQQHADALDLVREGASKPLIGYAYGARVDPAYDAVLAEIYDRPIEPAGGTIDENPLLLGVLLPHLSEMRQLALLLRVDANRAAAESDGETVIANMQAMFGIAEQLLDESFIISQLVGLAIMHLGFEVAQDHVFTAGLFSDEQLKAIAHRLEAVADGRVRLDASGELDMVEDILQRFYSDNGRGEGRFVGGINMDELYEEWGIVKPQAWFLVQAWMPVQSVLMATRQEVQERAERFVERAAADDALPPWRHDERASGEAYARLVATGVYHGVPIIEALGFSDDTGPMVKASASRDRVEAQRWVAMTLIALELHRRETGVWPQRLDELVPAFMPRMPLDPFDGQPVRYVPPAGEGEFPMLYSVGVDGVDDGGQEPVGEQERRLTQQFDMWATARSVEMRAFSVQEAPTGSGRGDWVMWPR